MTEAECNGIVEKNFSLIRSILDKICKQSDSLDDAVLWAVSAKNSLTNVYDFSPNELVYGENPTFPALANRGDLINESAVKTRPTKSREIQDHTNGDRGR